MPFDQAIQYIHPEDLNRVLAALRWAMMPNSGGFFDETYRTLGAGEGKLRWVRFWGQGYFTPAGALHRFSGVAQEVTQQVLAQQALAQSEQHLELLRDTVPAMIFYIDEQQRYQSYNKVFRDWFNVDEKVALGKTVREFLGEKAYQLTEPYLAKAYAGQTVHYELFAPDRMSVGRWLSIVYTPHKNEDQQVIGLIVHATDVTQSKQIEFDLSRSEAQYRALAAQLDQQVQQRTEELATVNEELSTVNEELVASNEELVASNADYAAINQDLVESTQLLTRSNANLQQFAYIASHDLQEPLRKIQSFSDVLKIQFGDQLGEGVDYLNRMQVAASRMSTLIRDLLTYSRISTQRETTEEVSLREVIDKVLIDLELVIQNTGATIQVDPLPTVSGDARQLGQLFQNLLSNALKFTRVESGIALTPEIRVRAGWVAAGNLPMRVRPTRASAAYHRIDISDNGIGFDEKYLDRIFQVFQRLHGKNDFAGTGIGLAISEKVATNHGGAITAYSQIGHGATFSVYLPM